MEEIYSLMPIAVTLLFLMRIQFQKTHSKEPLSIKMQDGEKRRD